MASRNLWIGVAIVIVIVIAGAGIYYYISTVAPTTPTPTRTITLYEGERVVGTSVQGVFGLDQGNMTSPGPTLNFKVGDTVKITVYNVGTTSHNWAIVNAKSDSAQVMFDAQVAAGGNPLAPGSSGTDTFTVNQAGNFYYICQVPGHIEVGMWGNVVVSP